MSKPFTCRELMGICDEIFYGDTLMEIVQKGMEHMESDDAHKDHIAGLAGGTREAPRNSASKGCRKSSTPSLTTSNQSLLPQLVLGEAVIS